MLEAILETEQEDTDVCYEYLCVLYCVHGCIYLYTQTQHTLCHPITLVTYAYSAVIAQPNITLYHQSTIATFNNGLVSFTARKATCSVEWLKCSSNALAWFYNYGDVSIVTTLSHYRRKMKLQMMRASIK